MKRGKDRMILPPLVVRNMAPRYRITVIVRVSVPPSAVIVT